MIDSFIAAMAASAQNSIVMKSKDIGYITDPDLLMLDDLDEIITSLGFGFEDFLDNNEVELNHFDGRIKQSIVVNV